MPSDAKFKGSNSGFRPINGGEGGSGGFVWKGAQNQTLRWSSPRSDFYSALETLSRALTLRMKDTKMPSITHFHLLD